MNSEKIRYILQCCFNKGENTSQVAEISNGVHVRPVRSDNFDIKDGRNMSMQS